MTIKDLEERKNNSNIKKIKFFNYCINDLFSLSEDKFIINV